MALTKSLLTLIEEEAQLMVKIKGSRLQANMLVAECLAESQCEMSLSVRKHMKKLKMAGVGIMLLILGLLLSLGMTDFALANEPGGQVFQRANTAMQGVLRQVRLISSIVAALFLTLAFLLKMLSKNQRTVDEANTWIKRIAIAWACINAVGFILTFIQEIIGPDVSLPTI